MAQLLGIMLRVKTKSMKRRSEKRGQRGKEVGRRRKSGGRKKMRTRWTEGVGIE